jgi:hypothetical protein
VTVRELRETLTRLTGLLQAADAKAATVKGLTEFVESITAFDDLSLKEFAKLAEAARAPADAKPTGGRKSSGAKTTADAGAVSQEVTSLYERAAEPAVTEEQIREACGKLGTFKKDALVNLSEGIGLFGMKAKPKDDIISAVTARLLDRKGAAIRRQLIDRPPPSVGSHPPDTAAS